MGGACGAGGVNVDVTSPGATLALGLLYLRAGPCAAATWLAPPATPYLLDFVRPDLLMLRVIARGTPHPSHPPTNSTPSYSDIYTDVSPYRSDPVGQHRGIRGVGGGAGPGPYPPLLLRQAQRRQRRLRGHEVNTRFYQYGVLSLSINQISHKTKDRPSADLEPSKGILTVLNASNTVILIYRSCGAISQASGNSSTYSLMIE